MSFLSVATKVVLAGAAATTLIYAVDKLLEDDELDVDWNDDLDSEDTASSDESSSDTADNNSSQDIFEDDLGADDDSITPEKS